MKKGKKIPFNLEKAKAGAKVVTREGYPVTMDIFHKDYFLGTFRTPRSGKLASAWYNNGKTYNTIKPNSMDLFLLT